MSDSLDSRLGFAARFDLILKNILWSFSFSEDRDDCLVVAVRTRDIGFFHISDDFCLLSLTDLTSFAIHEGSSELVTATLANFGPERDFVVLVLIVQTFHDDVKKLGVFVLAELSIFDIFF